MHDRTLTAITQECHELHAKTNIPITQRHSSALPNPKQQQAHSTYYSTSQQTQYHSPTYNELSTKQLKSLLKHLEKPLPNTHTRPISTNNARSLPLRSSIVVSCHYFSRNQIKKTGEYNVRTLSEKKTTCHRLQKEDFQTDNFKQINSNKRSIERR